jgi:uncharacterized membrane protein YfcA
MGPSVLIFLLVAGVGAGLIGSMAGLASLVSYPALLAAGLPPVTANITNTLLIPYWYGNRHDESRRKRAGDARLRAGQRR